ncbi:Nitrilase family, member 2 [Seminavis robusta]|uniref:Nitrilase family, member 2 n=1 Tax=Seminavis robusta TaxID=568900 RepID=A0A9N8H8F6_9STRA|nr:Nitrilase family, member 2 [Seminavis robusta]|eukprot:Sro167_g074630.1 Nitrilase family, member 2 (824) ;mRNA; r:95028-97586
MNYYGNGSSSTTPRVSSLLLLRSLLNRPSTTATGTMGPPLPRQRRSLLGLHTSRNIMPFLKKHRRDHADDLTVMTESTAATVATAASSISTAAAATVVDDEQNPAGKRQRRQAAATVVQNFASWSGVGKKSKAQPRPEVLVPPRGIGPVAEPNQNDVLCGRGGRINSHEGNVQFRDIVNDTKKDYLAKSTKKLEKAHIAAGVVQTIRNMEPSGRFLKEDSDTGMWWDIGDAKAIKKVGQALREDAPDIREELDEDVDGNEKGDNGDKKTDKKPEGNKKAAPKSSPKLKPANSDGSPKKHVIVLPTTRSNKRGEDNSVGAMQPQARMLQQQQQAQQQQQLQFQQVIPSSGNSMAQVSLPGSTGTPQQQQVFPPSAQSSNSSATLRHGQFSLRGQGAMSQKAMEMMNAQQMQNGNMMMNNGGDVFGRGFNPPSEMTLGSHGSSVSGLSGFTNSQMGGSLLSGLSDGVSSLTAGDSSYRRQLAMLNSVQAQQLAAAGMNGGVNNAAALAAMNNNAALAMNMNNANNNMGPPAVGMFQNAARGPGSGNGAMGSGNGSVYSGSRGSNGFNNYSVTSRSDLSGQTMPQAAAIFGRTSSHNDLSNLIREDMSMTEHSLLGGGIRGDANNFRQLNQQYQQQQLQQQLLLQQQAQLQQQQQLQQLPQQQQQQLQAQQQQQQLEQQQLQEAEDELQRREQAEAQHLDGMDASIMSGFSYASFNNRDGRRSHKDGMDFSVFSGASLANSLAGTRASARGAAYAPASARYARGDQSVSARSHVSNYSISAMSQSIASMSLHSGASVASFSAHSAMSDFSDTLLALDLAETSSKAL